MSAQIIVRYQSGWVFANRFQFATSAPDKMRRSMPDDQVEFEAKLDGTPVKTWRTS